MTKLNELHFLLEGITHIARIYETHSLLSLACERNSKWAPGFRRLEEGEVVYGPVDCMTCLVYQGKP